MIIPKDVLQKRLQGGPRADEARRIVDESYAICERAANELRGLDSGNTRSSGVSARAKFRAEAAPGYLAQLQDLAAPIASMRHHGRSPEGGQRSADMAALAEGAIWSARRKLAELSGVSPQTFGV